MARLRYKQILRWVIIVAIFTFLGRMVWENWRQVRDASFAFRSFPFILGTLLFAFSYFIQMWAWYLITVRLGIGLSPGETLQGWFYSLLGKYVPGKIWVFVGRFHFYQPREKSKNAIWLALYFETITSIAAAAILFWVSLFLFEEATPYGLAGQSKWLILLFIPVLIALHPKVLQSLLNLALHRLGKDPIALSMSYRDVLWILSVNLLSWVIGGAGFYLFIDSLFPVPYGSALYLTGALACSSILGMIALFAPGGLGVKEGTLVFFLSHTMAVPIAVVLSVLSRLWTTLIEIVLIGVIYLITRFRTRLKEKDSYV